MRRLRFILFSLFFLSLVSSSCKRDTWYNRVFHNTTARFNGYFNARTIFNETFLDIQKNHKDDFDQIIPVFVYGDAASLSTNNPKFEQVIRKCSNVIQNHELSKWIDDSFLLIGKAYFMKGEYFEAIETFQYVYTQYKKTALANEALIWLVRSYAESKQFAKAQGALDLINSNKRFPEAYKSTAYALQADLFIKQQRYDQAIAPLKQAIRTEKSKRNMTRYTFILGQLTRDTNTKEASAYFRQTLKGKPYYEMGFQARINLARMFDGNSSIRKARKQLRRLLKDDKNKDYRDEVYYEMAMLEFKAKNEELAISHLKSSAAASTKNMKQKTRSYLYLAEYYFRIPDYALAQQYYDSTSGVMDAGHPKHKEIDGKKRFLGDLVENLETIRLQDSLLALAQLPEKQLFKIIDKAIKDEERAADQARFEKEAAKNQPLGLNSPPPPGGGLAPPGLSATFYFYNQQAVSQGFSTFRQQWGSRELADNWRRSKKEQQLNGSGGQNNDDNGEIIEVNLDSKDPRSKYLSRIPRSEAAREQSFAKIQLAYFNLGNIYRDKLGDYLSAVVQFETLLTKFPGSELEPETYYRLALLHDLLNQPDKAQAYRDKLVNDYPRNQYAMLIKNPPKIETGSNAGTDEADSAYLNIYTLFKKGAYRDVIVKSQQLINSFPTSMRVPQVEYMSALSLGKTADTSMMKASLASLIGRYPGHAISKQAQEVLDLMDPAKRQALLSGGSTEVLFKKAEENIHYYVIAVEMATYNKNKEIEIKIANFNDSNFRNSKLKTQAMLYGKTYQFIVIREFPNARKALEFHTLFSVNPDIFKAIPADKYHLFAITKENYSQMYDKKQLREYIGFFQTDYINSKK